MKFLIRTCLWIILLFLFNMCLAAEKKDATVSIDFTGKNEVIFSLKPYFKGDLGKKLEPFLSFGHQKIFKIPEKYLPCQLVLDYRIKTGLTSISKPERVVIFLATDSLHLTVDQVDGKLDWHGDTENITAGNFRNSLYARQNEIHTLTLPFYNDTLKKLGLWGEVKEKYRLCSFNMNCWIDYQIKLHDELWVSHFWHVEKSTILDVYSDPARQFHELIKHFFTYEYFLDKSLVNSMYYPKLLTMYFAYIHLYAMLSKKKVKEVFSIFIPPVIEKASKGSPEVYQVVIKNVKAHIRGYDFDFMEIIEKNSPDSSSD